MTALGALIIIENAVKSVAPDFEAELSEDVDFHEDEIGKMQSIDKNYSDFRVGAVTDAIVIAV